MNTTLEIERRRLRRVLFLGHAEALVQSAAGDGLPTARSGWRSKTSPQRSWPCGRRAPEGLGTEVEL